MIYRRINKGTFLLCIKAGKKSNGKIFLKYPVYGSTGLNGYKNWGIKTGLIPVSESIKRLRNRLFYVIVISCLQTVVPDTDCFSNSKPRLPWVHFDVQVYNLIHIKQSLNVFATELKQKGKKAQS